MSTPSSLTVVYPPSFQNSFWSYPSYRRGAQSLYARLQAGIDENEAILAFVTHRAELEYTHAEALATPPPVPSFPAPLFKRSGGLLQEVIGTAANPSSPHLDGQGPSGPNARGFIANETATSHVFRLIQAETTTAQANAHGKTARNIEKLILNPFGKWSHDHRERVQSSWEHVDAALTRFERQKAEVEKLKNNYENKCRQADEAEDDAKFAPVDDHIPTESHVSQRSVSATHTSTSDEAEKKDDKPADPETLKRRETIRKQFGFDKNRATSGLLPAKEFAGVKLPTPPSETDKYTSLSPRIGASAGLSPSPSEELNCSGSAGSLQVPGSSSLKRSGTITSYISSAVERIPAPLKAAVGGVVSNEPKHIRLRRDADNAERVYEEAVRNLDRTRCQVEEILYEHYGLTQRWEADRIRAVKSVLVSYNQSLSSCVPALDQSMIRSFQMQEGLNPDLEMRALIREARTGPFHPAIERFQPYYHDEISLGRGAVGQTESVAWMTKNGGFGLDLVLVERLDYLEKMQSGGASSDGASKLAIIPPVLEALLQALERAYKDEERWPKLAAAAAAAEGEAGDRDSKLLRLSQEKRKAWIYEVPLGVTHRLRDALIAQLSPSHADMIYGSHDGSKLISDKMLDAYDVPVLAYCLKVWLLELEKSLVLEDLWDQIDSIYRAAAGQEQEALQALEKPKEEATKAEEEEQVAEKGKSSAEGPKKVDLATGEKICKGVLEDLQVVLNKLPKTHLACLDAIIGHLHRLVKETKTDESDLVYLNKLGLALGRAVHRPRSETPYTIAAQHPTLLVMDLVQHYEDIFPALVAKKEKEKEVINTQRKTPIRKRTKPVDQRISRSSIGLDLQQGAKKLLEQVVSSPPPKVPAKEPEVLQEESEEEKFVDAAPALETTNLPKPEDDDEETAPTPISQRVLSSFPDNEVKDDDDKPLSNVARLSRQFNSGGPRGPRPAGARIISGNKRESRDLAPSEEKVERRRSWSRTIESSDALIDD